MLSKSASIHGFLSQFHEKFKITGYNQSATGCGSQRRQCSCYSTKNLCKQHGPHPHIEYDFSEKHIH